MRKPFSRAGLHLRLFQGYRVQSFLIFNFRYQGDAPFGSTHQENLLSQFNQVQGTVTRQVASAQQVYKIVLWKLTPHTAFEQPEDQVNHPDNRGQDQYHTQEVPRRDQRSPLHLVVFGSLGRFAGIKDKQ